jgi:hypothetical protein
MQVWRGGGDEDLNPETTMKAGKAVLIRDFIIFLIKLTIDGFKDIALIWLSVPAVIIDLFFSRRDNRVFYKVMKLGERFDLWLNLHGALARSEGTGDGLFGGSEAGSKTLVGQIEQMVRGGDEPRKSKRSRS